MTVNKQTSKKISNSSSTIVAVKKVLTLTLVTALTFVGVYSSLSILDKYIPSAQAAPIPGSSTVGGANSVNMNKVYLNGSSETENLTVAPSGTVTVRVKYDNTGTQSVTDATIKDSLPAGFTYVPGSIKNCITPSSAEEACDTANAAQKNTMFSNLTGTGMSPVAGLYDAASLTATGGTDPSATSGLLEIGKKRYSHQVYVGCSNPTTGDRTATEFYGGLYPTNVNAPYSMSNLPPRGAPTCPSGYEYVIPNGTQVAPTFGDNQDDHLNKRYSHLVYKWCDNSTTGEMVRLEGWGGIQTTNNNTPFSFTNPGFGGWPLCASSDTGPTGDVVSDWLGARYSHMMFTQCQKGSDTYGIEGWGGIVPNNNSTAYSTSNPHPTLSFPTCAPGYTTTNSGDEVQDFLDATRGKGYVEYKMIAPSPTGTYGTGVTMQDGGTTTGTNDLTSPATDAFVSGSANSITVATPAVNTPTASIDKKFVVGTTETDNITTAAGSTVTERLYYNNTGDLSGTGATIKTALPAGFTYVPGSIKNCITPSSTEEVCDTANSAGKNTMFNNLTGTGMSPVAGLYDAASPTATGGTDPSATSGILEIGKKRYSHQAYIGCINPTTGDTNGSEFWGGLYPTNTGVAFSETNLPPSGAQDCPPGYEYVTGTNTSQPQKIVRDNLSDHMGKRYSHLVYIWCDYPNGDINRTEGWGGIQPTNTNTPFSANNPGIGGFPNCGSNATITNVGDVVSDWLGSRYTHLMYARCQKGFDTYGIEGWGGNFVNNISTPYSTSNPHPTLGFPSCAPGYTTTISGDVVDDFLDNTRGKGYVEYKMIAPSVTSTQTIPQNASINGSNFATANDFATLTVTATAPTTLTAANLSAGTCTAAQLGSITTCEYPLMGDANNTYALPTSGVTATVPGSTVSEGCNISSNGTTLAKLVCANIPTTGSTVGSQAVPTSLGANPTAALTLTAAAPTTLGANNLSGGTCSPSTVTVGATTTCEYPLTGNPSNNYTLPSGGVKATVPGADAQSDLCTIANNGTTSAKIVCANTPTTGTTIGAKQVGTTLGGTATAPLNVTSATTILTPSQIAALTPDCGSNLMTGSTTSCTTTLPAGTSAPTDRKSVV